MTVCGLQLSAPAATWNTKTNCGATGNGSTDDTAAINTCIGHLHSGDTLEFPAGTYLVSSQLTISISNVTIDGSNNTATILSNVSGNAALFVISNNGGSNNPSVGSVIALSTTANELATSFTTTSSLGVSTGDYVILMQGGVDSSEGSSATQCDPAGCRGEILQVASVAGNTVTVTTALHDTYNSSVNGATAQKLLNPLSNITVQNITFNGGGAIYYGFMLVGVVNSTISGVTATNAAGAAIYAQGGFNNTWNKITVTGAGSENCGAAVTMFDQGDVSINTMSVSGLNTTGPCLGDGAFGFAFGGSSAAPSVTNSVVNNLTVDSAGTNGGRPVKLDAARYNTFNSLTVENGCCGFNGMSFEYYSSHNVLNNCAITNNGGSGTNNGNGGVIFFGNYTQYNTLNNCTITGNGNVQVYASNYDTLRLGANDYLTVNGGTITGSNGAEPPLLISSANAYIHNVTISGPSGGAALQLIAATANACVNDNSFIPGTNLSAAISAAGTGNMGSGNILNGLSSNLPEGSCGTSSAPTPPTGLSATVQ